MIQQLIVLAALAEDVMSLAPSTHIRYLTTACISSFCDLMLSSGLHRYSHEHVYIYLHTNKQNK